MTKLTTFIIGVSTLTLCACGAEESIVGKWVQPVSGLPEIEQGFSVGSRRQRLISKHGDPRL